MRASFFLPGRALGVGSVALFALTLSSCLVGRVDFRPYQNQPFYAQTRQALDTAALGHSVARDTTATTPDTVRANWGRVSLVPPAPLPTAGYGNRRGRPFRTVHDSTWVRAVVLQNRRGHYALLAADLLIIPPTLTAQLRRDLPAIGWQLDDVFLTATHSHNATGSWAPGLVGHFTAGRYRRGEVRRLSALFCRAVQRADSGAVPVRVGFAQVAAGDAVNNRLVGNVLGTRDTLLQVIQLMKPSGETALLTSFGAHATVLTGENYALSRDYPGALVDALERLPGVTMATFSAGAVGSQSPNPANLPDTAAVAELGQRLAQKIIPALSGTVAAYPTTLRGGWVPLTLRRPQWRISARTYLRPWLFNALMGGRYPATLTALQIGPVLWLGTPCDFSGELTAPLRALAQRRGLNLVVTSFNGGYVGYLTPDKYYATKTYETRTMGWYGSQNGAYFSELLARLIAKF